MWGLLSMDGCLFSRLLDTSSQVLGTIWRCLGKPRGPLWQHFMATVISVSRNSNHSSYAHTLILGKQRWDSYFCSSVFFVRIIASCYSAKWKTLRSNLYPLHVYGLAEELIYVVHDIVKSESNPVRHLIIPIILDTCPLIAYVSLQITN